MGRKPKLPNEQPAGTGRSDGRTSSCPSCTRRRYIGAGAAILSPVVGSGDPDGTTHFGITYSTVVDAVSDLGFDPTGDAPIDGSLGAVDGDTLVKFPNGTYLVEDAVELAGRVGLSATGDQVQLVAAPERGSVLVDSPGPEPLAVDGLDIGQEASGTVAGLRLRGRRVVAQDIDVHGPASRRTPGLPVLDIASRSGPARVDGLRVVGEDQLGRSGVHVPSSHSGRLEIKNADLGRFESPAIQTLPGAGPVTIGDSRFHNNAIAVQLGGPGAIERCKITVDRSPPARPGGRPRPYLRSGVVVGGGPGGVTGESVGISETRIRMGADTAVGAGVVVASTGPPVDIAHSQIQMDAAGRAAVLARQPDDIQTGGVRVWRSAVTGSGRPDAAIELSSADYSRIARSTVALSGGDTDGLSVADGEGVSVTDTELAVGGLAVDAHDSLIDAARLTGRGHTTDGSAEGSLLTIASTDDPVGYGITATERITRVDGTAGGYGPTGATVEGVVVDETLRFRVDGVITRFSLGGPASVYVDGEAVDPFRLGASRAGWLECRPGTEYTFAPDRLWARRDTITGNLSENADIPSRHHFHGAVPKLSLCGSGSLRFPTDT